VLDVRRLKVLKAVVDSGSVAGAAAVLNFSPSAVSQHVTALERETGCLLLERAGRGVRPTEAALLLCEHASRVLATVHEAEEALAALRSGQIGRLRLAAFPTAGSSLVPGALAAFQLVHPNVHLDLTVNEPEEAVIKLRGGAIDLAITVEPYGPGGAPDDGLLRWHLLADPFRVVLPRKHPLAGRRSVDLALLAGDRWINVSSSPDYCQQAVDDACVRAGFQPTYGLEADEYPTVEGFVAAGLGVALVPQLALGTSVHMGVVARHVKGDQPVRQVWAATRPALSGQPAVQAMVEFLRQAAAGFAAERP
jgi:DNA-binding transcriptional LysR family regulator